MPIAISCLPQAFPAMIESKSDLVIVTVVLPKLRPPATAAFCRCCTSLKFKLKFESVSLPLANATPLPVCVPVVENTKPTPALASLRRLVSTVVAPPIRSLVCNATLRVGGKLLSAVKVAPLLMMDSASCTVKAAVEASITVPVANETPAPANSFAWSYVTAAVVLATKDPLLKCTPCSIQLSAVVASMVSEPTTALKP